MTAKGHFIKGSWIEGAGPTVSSLNPSTGEPIWSLASATASQVDQAVQAATEAFESWSRTPLPDRIALIRRFGEMLGAHQEELAKAISQETGKILWEARTEVAAMIGKIGLSIRAYEERTGTRQDDIGGAMAVLRHRPHGVMAVFGPYNFPGHLPNGHIVPALIAGNTIVFKPSELTPAFGEKMLECWIEAGLPKGVINLVQGAKETGIALAGHDDIQGLLFTGSSQTGKILHKQFAGRPEKLLALEMGGNNPLIVGSVKDQEATIWHIIQSAFITSGQRCTCARRLIIIEDGTTDGLIDKLVKRTQNLTIGAWDQDPPPFFGPVISTAAAKAVLYAETELSDMGGDVLLTATQPRGDALSYVTPSIVDVTGLTGISDEEVFGPLLKIIRVPDLDTAINVANDTAYGLSGGVLSDDRSLYIGYLDRAQAGIINWNRPTTGASGAAPFGGVGCSGNHRASAWYAADYCAYPVASVEQHDLTIPESMPPGLNWDK